MRWVMAVVLVGGLAAAARSEQPLVTSNSTLPSFEFKGIRAKDTIEQHRREVRRVSAYSNGGQGGDLLDDQVSGELAFPTVIFGAEGIRTLRGSFSDSVKLSTIHDAFAAKWGEPSNAVILELQNGYGAKVMSHVYKWAFAEGVMTLDEGGFSRRMSFEYRSNEQQKRLDDDEKPKSDF